MYSSTSSTNRNTHTNLPQPQATASTPHIVANVLQAAATAASLGNLSHSDANPADNLTQHNAARANCSTIISPPIGAPQRLATTRRTRPPASTFDVEAQAPLTRSQTMYGRFTVWHTEHKAALQTTGAVFAILFFSLEMWGLINGLVEGK